MCLCDYSCLSELNMFCYRSFEDSSILDTDEFLDWLSILKNNDRRYAHDTKLARSRRVGIDIMFHDFCLSIDFSGELLEAREHDLTWSTPLSPEIDEGHSGSNIGCEIGICRNKRRHR